MIFKTKALGSSKIISLFLGPIFLAVFACFAFGLPTITINQPPTITANPPLLNVTFNETVNQTWISIDNGANTTICYNCSNFSTTLYQEFPQNTTGLAGWWKFNEGGGNQTSDSSGMGNTGNLTGMNTTGNATSGWTSSGKFGNGLQFDGVNNYVDAGNRTSLNITNAITVEAWIKTSKASQDITVKGAASSNRRDYNLHMINGKLYFRISNDGIISTTISGNTLINDSTWRQVVGVYDGSYIYVYVNGVSDATPIAKTGTIYQNSDNVRFGLSSIQGWFNGTIDEVRIYNRSLSATEVYNDYALSAGQHNITIYANDTSGNINTTQYQFTIDTTPPAITIQSPSNQTYATNSIWFNITLNKTGSWAGYSLDGASNITLVNSTGNWNKQTTLADGYHNVTFYANDTVGNMANSSTIYFRTDTAGPVLTIASPQNISYNTVNLSLNFTAIDTNSGINTTWYNYNGTNTTITGNTTFTAINNNQSMLILYANDSAGNVNSTSVSFTIDTIYPSIYFIAPTPTNNTTTIYPDYAYLNTTVTDEHTSGNISAFIDCNSSLVGWWRFNNENGENSTFFRDWSSYGNNGTCSGTACPSLTGGKFGNALQFDGVNDYVDAGNRTSLNITNAITVEAWIKTSARKDILQKAVAAGNQRSFGLNINSAGQLVLSISANGTGWNISITGSTNISDGQWKHITTVYSGSQLLVYVNGVSDKTPVSYSSGIYASTSTLKIGSSYFVGNFNGTIDEVKIWNRALSQNEIRASYDAGLYRLYRRIGSASNSSYDCEAYAQNNAGNVNQTEIRTLNIVNDNHTYFLIAAGPAIKNTKILPNMTLDGLYNDAGYTSSDNISLQISRGEYEPTSFVIMSNPDLADISITASDLSSGQNTIPASNIDIRTVKVWWQAGTNVYDAPLNISVLSPELLLHDDYLVIVNGSDNFIKGYNCTGCYINISNPHWSLNYSNLTAYNDAEAYLTANVKPVDADTLQPINLTANTLKQIWVTVYIPENSTSGTYTGTISITFINSTSELEEHTINLQAEVLPFALENSSLDYSIYYRSVLSDNASLGDSKSAEQISNEMRDLKAHGIDYPTSYQGWSNISDYLTIRDDKGFKKDKIYYLGIRSDSYDGNISKYNATVSNWINISRYFGYDDVYIYAIDEASGDALTAERSAFNATHYVGAKNFVACAGDCYTRVGDLLDTAVFASLNTTVASQFHSVGHKIYSYNNPQAGVEQPETYRRNYGSVLWKAGYDGAMDYAYQAAGGGIGFIWNDYDYSSYRDHVMAYPTINGVIDTIQWEGFREGVDDVRYITTLQRYINLSKSGNATAVSAGIQAESWLNSTDFTNGDLDQIRSDMIAQIKNMYYALQDTTHPSVSLSISSPSIYQTQSVTISCSATDTYLSTTSLKITKPNGVQVTATCNQPFTDTSAAGTYTVTYSATDTSGNSASTSQSFTVSQQGGSPIRSITSSSSSEKQTNIITSEDLEKIVVNLNSTVPYATVSIAKLSNAPANVPSVTEPTYQYLKITKNNFNNSDVKSATIEFNVNKSWIQANNVSSVYLARYENGWNKLRTELTNSTSTFNSYKAYAGSFSYFAIIGEVKHEVSPAGNITYANQIETGKAEKPMLTEQQVFYVVTAAVGIAAVLAGILYKSGKRKMAKTGKNR